MQTLGLVLYLPTLFAAVGYLLLENCVVKKPLPGPVQQAFIVLAVPAAFAAILLYMVA